MQKIPIVQRAAEKAGGLSELARKLGIRHTSIYRWRHRVPAELATVTSGTVL